MKRFIYLSLATSITLTGCNLQDNILQEYNKNLETKKILEQEEEQNNLGTRLNPYPLQINKQIKKLEWGELIGYTIKEFYRGEEANSIMKDFYEDNLEKLEEDEEYLLIKINIKYIENTEGKDDTFKMSILRDILFYNQNFDKYPYTKSGYIPQKQSHYDEIYPKGEITTYLSTIVKKNDQKPSMKIGNKIWIKLY
jgi:hypothetical protein